jgi:hypothetical protein
MSCIEKLYIAVTQFQDFKTSLAGLLKQALLNILGGKYEENFQTNTLI